MKLMLVLTKFFSVHQRYYCKVFEQKHNAVLLKQSSFSNKAGKFPEGTFIEIEFS